MENKNSLVLSETGSGKTLIYLTPIIDELLGYHSKLINCSEEERAKLCNQHKGALILTSSK